MIQAIEDITPTTTTTTAHRPRAPRKSSLGYILGSFSPDPSFSSSSPRSTSSRPSSCSQPPSTKFISLPRPLLVRIATHLVLSSPHLHPANLLPLLSTCRKTHTALSLRSNPNLYRDLYAATFDTDALIRRYAWISAALAKQSGGKKKAFDLFGDPKSWAEDYKLRWNTRRRMREAVRTGEIGEGRAVGAEGWRNDDIMPELWTAWFLATEDDGRNVNFLKNECLFSQWLTLYYSQRLLKEALEPGYPKATADKGLSLWAAMLSGTNLIEPSIAAVDEKIFMLRPFIFACARYDISFGPWQHRRLPLCAPGCTCTTHVKDLHGISKAAPYDRFGYTWSRAPPHFVAGAYLLFLRLLERQSAAIQQRKNPNSTTPSPDDFGPAHISPSTAHDREWQRNSVCQDPHISAGLPPLTFRGALEGGWKGQFLFYSLDQYKEVVGGNMRAVYTGEFGAQGMELDLRETIIKVKKGEEGGMENRMLSAGFAEFDDDDPEEDGENPEQKRVREGYGQQVLSREEEDEDDEEGWTKEILLSGRAKSNWGWARVRGRVRAWDGLVSIMLTYDQNPRHPMGRWLWRGYIQTGETLVGRWRDTFTPAHLQGHEGAFGMVRSNDVCRPSPKASEVDHQGDQAMEE